MIIVKVVFPLPIRQCFEYFISDKMCPPVIGGRIIVPFRSQDIIGIVISFYEKKEIETLNLRYVKSLIDTKSLYTDILLDLLKWISDNYYCPIGNLFFSILPKLLRHNYIIKNKYIYQWNITKKGEEIDEKNLINRKKQLNALLVLKKNNILDSELKKYNLSKFILKKLEQQGLCKISAYSKPIKECKKIFKNQNSFLFNKKIADCIDNILIKKQFSSWLFTKTNLYIKVKFYLQLIRSVLYQNKQVLILVPYIKNINILEKFLKKFFSVSINIMHSELTHVQSLNTWTKIKNSKNCILIGLNKSVLLPFINLGIIIVLEEHDFHYKCVDQCRYNARDIGILRAYKEKIPVILDSDTPSLKTLYNVFLKKCLFIKIKQNNPILLSNSKIINLRKERTKFGLSLTLIDEINKNFQKKQVLLIFNHFNLYFFILVCNFCKYVYQCIHCQNYLEVNEHLHILFCRFCFIKVKKPLLCFYCKFFSLIVTRIGIEEIKDKIKNIFPKKSLFFLIDKKKFEKKKLDKKSFDFSLSNLDLILTTEDIVKNYYFPHVKLISLISIDNYFLRFDYRSIEYFSQFYINLRKITRKNYTSLKILVQTSFSRDPNFIELHNQGYFSFVDKILAIRKKFLLPPWSIHSIIYSQSSDSKKNIIFLNLLCEILKKKSKKNNYFLWFVGPHPSLSIQNKKKNIYQLLIQCSSRAYLNNLLKECINTMNYFSISKKVKWIIDIEPN